MKYSIATFFIFFAVLLLSSGNSTAWSASAISGVLDTSVYVYPAKEGEPEATSTHCRIHESLALGIDFTDSFSFNTYTRVTYGTNSYEYPDTVALDFYYGYFSYTIKNVTLQAGRFMQISNLVYTNFDGLNLNAEFKSSQHVFTLGVYGGMVVNDDYLEENSLKRMNCFDLRNAFIDERRGDYVCGLDFTAALDKIMILGIHYQPLFNSHELTEHYLSLDFDTDFSKKVRLYGYSTFDFVEMEPVNALCATQVEIIKPLSLILEYEYFRPVFPKESYFWAYFKTYGSQEASTILLYQITRAMSLDFDYSVIFYETEDDPGHEVSAGFEHHKLFNSFLRIMAEFLTGPEGDKLTFMGSWKKRYNICDFILGSGLVLYGEDELSDTCDVGTFATAGIDIEAHKSVLISLTGEYYYNPQYEYDLRCLFSIKYFFNEKKP